jgi:hypothetical protein
MPEENGYSQNNQSSCQVASDCDTWPPLNKSDETTLNHVSSLFLMKANDAHEV